MLRAGTFAAILLLCAACGPQRVLVVGLDGANWTILDPLIDAGYLPTIGALVRAGARFDLACRPAAPASACFCPPVWSSIASGQPASVHGIVNFHTPSTVWGDRAIWDVVRAYGGHSTLIAYRGTWPPNPDADIVLTEPGAEVAGSQLYAMIPEASTHPGAEDPDSLAKPVDLLERLEILPFYGDPDARLPAWVPFAKDRVSMQTLLRLALIQREQAPWEQRVPDLTMILLHSPDRSEHVGWSRFQRQQYGPVDEEALLAEAALWDGPAFNPAPFQWSRLPAQYQEIDEWLAQLLEVMAYDYVVFVSDHGMTARTTGTGLAGAHDPDHPEAHLGILSLTGPGVRAGVHVGRASVLDVAPTLAYLLGLPVADDLPGDVRVDAFRPERVMLLPPERVPSW